MIGSTAWRLDVARFFRRDRPEAGPVTLDRRRVYILPTRSGAIFAAVLMAMLLGAVNYDSGLGYALTFLLGSVAVVSILHTFRNINGLAFRTGRPQPVFAGEAAAFPLSVENRNQGARYAVSLALADEPPLVVDLRQGDARWVGLHHRTTRRGRLPLGRITVSTRFPLGLFRAWAYVHLDAGCLVYPRPSRERGLPRDQVRSSGTLGDRGAGSDDFAALRTYHPGDSLRHVHWKAAARQQGLLTKQFGGGSCEELWLRWEDLPGDAEGRLSRLCRWVLEAEGTGIAYGLALPGTEIPPARGEGHRRRCLEALALFGEKP